MKKHLPFLVFVVCLLLGAANVAHAQDTVLHRAQGKLDSLHSASLNQERWFQVFLPGDYKAGSRKQYDVLYVLDGGNWNTGLVADVQHFVENEGLMPATIIVSVMGIDRNVELTPTHVADVKGSGGGPAFLSYLKNELIPYINKNYPSNGDNTLWGHSLSGMFAIYAMASEPDLFKSYIAVDPSIWWDHCYVAKLAAAKLPGETGPHRTLFIAAREGALTGMRDDTLETVLRSAAAKNLIWKLQVYSTESHSSVRFKASYDGLRFTYEGVRNGVAFHPMNGIVLKDKPYPIWCFDDTTGLHYTLDGTVPTTGSPKVLQSMLLIGPQTVIFKSFSNRVRYEKIVKGVFTTTAPPSPVKLPKGFQSGGFNYALYTTNGDSTADLKKMKPALAGMISRDFDLDKLPLKNKYTLVMDGLLEVKEDGYYLFALQADKGSKLLIGGKTMITWEGNYAEPNASCIVPLRKGFYPVRLAYFHQNPDFKLNLVYITPANSAAKNAVPVPLALQYGKR